jgi:DNA-directed RNA polymerase subunit beta'
VDHLKGLKENVIMGRIIPAGTGVLQYRGAHVLLESDEMVEGSEVVEDSGADQPDEAAQA